MMRSSRLFMLLFLLGVQVGYAQHAVDSLRNAIAGCRQDTTKVKMLLQLGKELHWLGQYDETIATAAQVRKLCRPNDSQKSLGLSYILSGQAYIRKGELDTALRHFQNAIRIFSEKNLITEQADAHLYVGQVYDYKGKFKEALHEYDVALQLITKQSDESIRAKIVNSMGITYFNIGSYDIALEQYQEAARISADLKNDKFYASVLNNIGAVYAKLSQHEDAIRYFMLYLDVMKKLNAQYFVAVGYLNIGESYKLLHNDEQALLHLTKAIAIQEAIHDKRGLALSYSNLADIAARKNNIAEAQQYYTQSVALAREIANDELLMNPLAGAAAFYIRLQKFALAEQYIREIQAISEKTGSKKWLQQSYLLTSRLDSAHGNYRDAYAYFKRSSTLKDSLLNDHKTEQIVRMQELFQSERKDKEIRLLSESNKLAAMERASSRRLFTICILFLSLVILGMIYWLINNVRHSRQLRVQREEVRQRNGELKDLLEKIENQNDMLTQRNQSLEELHREKDGLMGIVAHDLRSPLNRITGLSDIISLCGALNPEQKMMIESIKKVCGDGNNLIKDLLAINQFETIDRIDMKSLDLNRFVSTQVKHYYPLLESKKMQLHVNTTHEPVHVYTDQAYLSRILDNLITNAIKFSEQGSSVHIDVQPGEDKATMLIRDEGPGFREEDLPHLFKKFTKLSARPTNGESSTGLGLAIVKLLVEKLNGMIRVESQPGMGACFIVQLPLSLVTEESVLLTS